jgi:hypothetical protein
VRPHEAEWDLNNISKTRWHARTERLSLANFRTLNEHADRIRQWPAWREKALAFIRSHNIEHEKKQLAKKQPTWGWTPHAPDHSLLVEIFLWEKDVEAACHVNQRLSAAPTSLMRRALNFPGALRTNSVKFTGWMLWMLM